MLKYFICFFLFNPIFAQYTARVFTVENGLPGNTVTAITQTAEGFMWIGTKNGLAKFDGLNFTHFSTRNTPSFTSDIINCLYTDNDNTLWIGFEGGGAIRFKDGIFQRFDVISGLSSGKVKSICRTKDGILWIATDKGLDRLIGGKFYNQTFLAGPGDEIIQKIVCDQKGGLWVKMPDRFFNISFSTGKLNIDSLVISESKFFFVDSEGAVYFEKSGQVCKYTKDQIVIPGIDSEAGAIYITDGGRIASVKGSEIFILSNGVVSKLSPLTYSASLNLIYQDTEGNFWISGEKSGLIRVKKSIFEIISSNKLDVYSFARLKGKTFAGTSGGIFEISGKMMKLFNSDFQALSMAVNNDELWVAAGKDGLFKVNLIGNSQKILNEGFFNCVYSDIGGGIWAGTSDQGVFYLKDGFKANYSESNGLSSYSVSCIIENNQGDILIGTLGGGVNIISGNNIKVLNRNSGFISDYIYTLYIDSEGVIWVGASGGLAAIKENQIKYINSESGMPDDVVFQITEDNFGYLWLGVSKGVIKVDKKLINDYFEGSRTSIPLAIYDKFDGLISSETEERGYPGSLKLPHGDLIFAVKDGIAMIANDFNPVDSIHSPVFIEQVLVDGVPQQFTGKLVIPHDAVNIEIVYSAVNFTNPSKISFRYYLHGLENTYNKFTKSREAFYTNLPPGNYRFNVQSANRDGSINPEEATLLIEVIPPFWLTWYFKIIVVILLGGFLLLIHKIRLNRALEIEKIRGRIASDLHDETGALLTKILMRAQLVKSNIDPEKNADHLEKIAETGREVIQSMSDVVWSIDPQKDTFEALINQMKDFAASILPEKEIIFQLYIDGIELTDKLNPGFRRNVYLIFKESITNIVKHSGATKVVCYIAKENSRFEISIRDNGNGFNPDDSAKGNGLKNISKRVADLKGNLTINQENGVEILVIIN
ncbi:MAG: hypothetical protein IAE91_08030 [Ignavibacteriaceae bacterium]|nr:hypothetical protein [Ignavibacteriaceae bacterium]